MPLAIASYRDDGHTWLSTAPLLTMPSLSPRKPYAETMDGEKLDAKVPAEFAPAQRVICG